MRQLGAVPGEPGLVEFRVWAPGAQSVTMDGRPLEPEGDGCFAATLEARPGDDYRFALDGAGSLADPCSRWQPEGLRGPSRVLDTRAIEWTAAPPRLALDELVLYELHVGTFTREGTFEAAIPHLAELAELGVTAIELMPVATFPGERGWGYDGVLTFAPHRAYGGPQGLARLVDAAHAAGLGVFLDVVYNHIGPGSELVGAFGPYFTRRHKTFWGEALDYRERGVREWAIQNAEQWVRDFRVDGLRLDATHAVFDDSQVHVLAELAARVKAASPHALVVAEMAIGDRRPLEEWGHDAQWADELHHALHVLLTGEREGYYRPYGKASQVAAALEDPARGRLVVFGQNHDQVGNRALGDRLPPPLARIAGACVLLSPHVPLLFMGEEYGETAPFQFFADHDDPAIAEATRAGRRKEFKRFAAFAGEEVPDPQALETFERSRLDRSAADPEVRAFYAELLRLRRTLPAELDTDVDERRRVLRLRRGDVELVADFRARTMELMELAR
jgi:maltooligosyltrehalose trehalohydrolase